MKTSKQLFSGAVKNLDNVGRITLPAVCRKLLNWDINTSLEICMDFENQQLVIREFNTRPL